ncbi:hypothetical protein Tco_1467229 [Tanacetum coccineum]
MSSYSIPHGLTNHSSCSTHPQISRHWEMQQLCCASKYPMLTRMQDIRKVPDTKDTIRFKLDTQDIVYTVDMFRDTLKLLVETLDNPFLAPVNIETIESFMHTVGYQGVVDKKKDVIQYPRFTKFIIADLMKKYPFISPRLDEDYHSIKDDIPLVSVYTTGNVTVQGMLIPDAFLTKEIRATDDYKEYETVFVNVVVPMNQPQLVVSTQGTHMTTPRAHRTPTLTAASPQGKKRKQSAGETSSLRKSLKVTIIQKKQSTTLIQPPSDDRQRDEIAEATLLSLTLHKTALAAEAQENVAKLQEKLVEEEIEKMVEGGEDEESYASEFDDSLFNDDDDSGTRIEPESHKENLEVVDEDEVNDKVKQDEKKDDDAEKIDDAAKEKDNDDHIDHTLFGTHVTGSMETRNEQMQTPIPTPTRSPREDLSSDKTISEELMAKVSPTTATTSKDSSKSKSKKVFTSNKTKILLESIAGMCRRCGQICTILKPNLSLMSFFMGKIREVLDHCNNVVPEMTFAKTNEMIKEEMPRLVNLVVNKD